MVKKDILTKGFQNKIRQECITVGCVPPASVAISLGRGVSLGLSAWGVSVQEGGVCPGDVCQGCLSR